MDKAKEAKQSFIISYNSSWSHVDQLLRLFQGKKCERTTYTNVQIGVRNVQKIFSCGDQTKSGDPPEDSVNITMKVFDVNDAPVFRNSPKNTFQKEEDKPGKQMYHPDVYDVDSDVKNIRLVSTYFILTEPIATLLVKPGPC